MNQEKITGVLKDMRKLFIKHDLRNVEVDLCILEFQRMNFLIDAKHILLDTDEDFTRRYVE